jgi:hypothetical protein
MDLVSAELPARTLVVAIDPGKATNRVLLANGERGLIGEPVSLPTLREGIERMSTKQPRWPSDSTERFVKFSTCLIRR